MQLSTVSNDMLLDEIKSRFLQRDLIIEDSKKMLKDLEEINAKLTKSEENKSKFMSIIKNEFNNPLFSMISLSKSLLNATKDEKIKRIGDSLYEESLMLNFQIKNIITAADIESGTIDIQTSKINFSELILEIEEELQYPLLDKNIDLKTTIISNNDIYMDREKLHLILLNLLSNSIEFSPHNSKVIVEIAEQDDEIKLTIKDFGEGIEESEMQNIFQRFYQAHSGMNRIHRGQGLGLSVVQDLVNLLDGKIEIESEKSKYTTFEVFLRSSGQDNNELFDDNDFLFSVDTQEAEEF